MTLTRLLLLVVLTSSSTASHPFVSQNQPTKARLDSVVNSTDLKFYDSNVTNDNSFSSLHNAALHLWRSLFPKPGQSEILWSQPQDHERRVQSTTKRSSGFDDSSRSSEETQFSKSISKQNKRIKRATSKFTGLVVGASRDNKLLQTVTTKLNTVESLIWSLQSQYTKPFIASKHEPATIVGTFSSDLRTNFHGFRSEWNLRRSVDYSLHDVNSLTTLMVLQCLVEAALFGSATAPSVSNISIAVSSLASFYTHTYSRGSSIVTLWPEKLLTGNDIWVSRSENIVGGQVKDNNTFKQLQQLAQSCKCEPAQSGLKEISQNKLCEDHFSTPLSQLFADLANPPDFLTSFSNLALGSILQFNFPGKKSGMYKAVSQMWLSANSDVQTLINKLKSTAIVFPGKVQEASVKNSTNNNTNNTSSNGKAVTHSIKRRAINVNSTLDNSTSSSEEGYSSSMLIGDTYNYADDNNTIPENTTESPFLISLDVKANGGSDSTKAAGNSDSADEVPTNTTASDTPLQRDHPHREDPQSNLQNTSDSHATPLSPDSNTTVTSTQSSVANITPESNIRKKTYISTTPPSLDSNTTVTSTQPSVANTTPESNIQNKSYIPTTPPSIDSNTTVTSTQPPVANTTPESNIQNKSYIPTTPPSIDSNTTVISTQPPVANTTSSPDIVLPITASPTQSITTEKANASVKVEKKVRVNQILSSESFYAIRNYLDAVLPVAKKDVILIPSLITDDENIDDKKKVLAKNDGNIWHNGRQFHSYNNVNLMTTATTLHAIVVSSMAGIVKLQDDAMLQNIVETSLQLLTWFLSNPQEVVTMATLSKFPSRYQLYWVTARVAFQLNSRQAQTSGMFQFADAAIRSFVKALRENMTFSILQSITDGGLGQDGKTRVYIDDFLGVSDVDDKGQKLVSGDDRIFTSAMAINTLIATWTVQRDNGVLEFVKEIGDPVRIAINSLVNYIYGAVTDPTASNLNAFMSEQPKNCQTLPARYPANIITSSDGTELNPSQPELNHRFGVKGYISKEDYQKLLTKSTFGYTTRGGNLEDLNSPTSIFRFWSSTAYTKAVALLAIAQAANLETDTVS